MSSSAEAAAPEVQSARESKRAKTSHMEVAARSQTQAAPGQAGLATMASVNTPHTSHTSHTASGNRSKHGGGPTAAAATVPVSEYRYSASNVFARMQTGLQAVEGLLFDQVCGSWCVVGVGSHGRRHAPTQCSFATRFYVCRQVVCVTLYA